jgi:hypothetical protein
MIYARRASRRSMMLVMAKRMNVSPLAGNDS